jgi:hypothetical protein
MFFGKRTQIGTNIKNICKQTHVWYFVYKFVLIIF